MQIDKQAYEDREQTQNHEVSELLSRYSTLVSKLQNKVRSLGAKMENHQTSKQDLPHGDYDKLYKKLKKSRKLNK
jgi:hypothetical protein